MRVSSSTRATGAPNSNTAMSGTGLSSENSRNDAISRSDEAQALGAEIARHDGRWIHACIVHHAQAQLRNIEPRADAVERRPHVAGERKPALGQRMAQHAVRGIMARRQEQRAPT